MSEVFSSNSAMCTAPVSPQSPSNDWLPPANRSIAWPQSSSVTFARGRIMALSQQPGDVLEAADQRGRHIDARHEHDGEMGEHRHIGRLRRRGRSYRLAKYNGVEPQEQTAEGDQNSEH